MWKEVPRTRKKEVLSSHHVESSRPSLTTVSLEVEKSINEINTRKNGNKYLENKNHPKMVNFNLNKH